MPVDKSKPVCVTGASGFVGSWVTKELLDNGYTVHATVRKIGSDSSKHVTIENLSPGTDASKLKLFEADLMKEGSFDAAIEGCGAVMHTASPFSIVGKKDPKAAFVDPALQGTTNVLNACTRAKVTRVVVTSSVVAVTGKNEEGRTYTAEDWNTHSSLTRDPYPYSKTLAEKKAWELEKDAPWDLRTVNPGLVIGPLLSDRKDNEGSLEFMTNMTNGSWATGANFVFGVVDVRDVAAAHRKAMELDEASGRYIAAQGVYSLPELGGFIKGNPNVVPKKVACSKGIAPKAILYMFGWALGIKWSQVQQMGVRYSFDGSRVSNDLGITYRTPETMCNDMVNDMAARKFIQAPAA